MNTDPTYGEGYDLGVLDGREQGAKQTRRVCVAQASRAIEQADNTGDALAALLGLHSLLRSSEWADLDADL